MRSDAREQDLVLQTVLLLNFVSCLRIAFIIQIITQSMHRNHGAIVSIGCVGGVVVVPTLASN